ncbi:MAG: hypothetical protein ACFFDB_00395 [Promethearchaeota archaeon]
MNEDKESDNKLKRKNWKFKGSPVFQVDLQNNGEEAKPVIKIQMLRFDELVEEIKNQSSAPSILYKTKDQARSGKFKGNQCQFIEYNTQTDINEFNEIIEYIRELSLVFEETLSRDLNNDEKLKINKGFEEIGAISSNPRQILQRYIELIEEIAPNSYKDLLLKCKILIIQSELLKDED